jgi:hypothetical protein
MKHRLASLASLAAVVAIAIGAAIALNSAGGSATQPAKTNTRGKSQPAKKKAPAADQAGEKAIRTFMRQKLGAMHQILQGIVTEDYGLIQTNAARMRKMGTAAQWNIVQGPIYGDYRSSFRRSAELLTKAAKEKNADAAMLVYMQATLNCIECHRYVRKPNVKRKNRIQ